MMKDRIPAFLRRQDGGNPAKGGKRRWPRILLWAGLAALLLCNGGARRLLRNAWELRRGSTKLEELKRQESQLRSELKSLKTDNTALENIARRELGLLKAGEIEYRFNRHEKGERMEDKNP